MKNKTVKIIALISFILFLLSGCAENRPASSPYNSSPLGVISSSTNDSCDSADSESSQPSSSTPSENKDKNKNNSSKNNSQNNNQSGSQEPDKTPSELYPAALTQGGTVIGTTSKGYTITEKNGVTYVNGILVVNKTYSLPENYASGLNSLSSKAFNKMKAAAKKDGISIWISSGYRSYKSQKKLYDSYCLRDGAAAADRYSARPGHSEHQSGFAIDVNLASTSAYEGAYKRVGEWLEAHCAEFGFIIRYPKGKESITGYQYEPWHIRYVGYDLAVAITQSGLTMEEYLGITSRYETAPPIDDNPSEGEGNFSSEPEDGSSSLPEDEGSSSENGESSENSSSENSSEDVSDSTETENSSE